MSSAQQLYDAQQAAELPQSDSGAIPRPAHPRIDAEDLDQRQALLALVALRQSAANAVNEYVALGHAADEFEGQLRLLADTVRDVDELLYPAPPPDAPEAAEVFYARALQEHDRVFLEEKGGWVLVTKIEHGRTAVTLGLDGCHGRDIHQTQTINADTPVVAWRGR